MAASSGARRLTETYQAPIETESEIEGFFAGCQDSFDRACNGDGSHLCEYTLRLAGRLIALRFSGRVQVPYLLPALAHLLVDEPGEPDFVIHLWDGEATKCRLPARPWERENQVGRGDVRGFSSDRFRVAFSLGVNVLSLFDARTRRGWFHTFDIRKIPFDYMGSPLLLLLHWWASGQGMQLIHGAAVGTPGGCMVIAARGGSGKSTTSLKCLESGMSYLGDDYCLVRNGSPPTAFSVFSSAKMHGSQLSRFPGLAAFVANRAGLDREKAVLFLHPHFREQFCLQAPVQGLCIATLSGRAETSLEPISAIMALRSLAPTTLFQLAGADANNLHQLACFVRSTACFRLHLGAKLEAIPEVLRAFLDRTAPGSAS